MRAWMTRPTMTERVYIPNWLHISARSVISKIFPVIRNKMSTGVYLRGEGKGSQMTTSLNRPDDDGHHSHDGLVQAVKKMLQDLALLLHVTDDQAQADGEDHQS